MKVLHLIDSGGLYGAEKMLLTLVEAQLKQGLDPLILSVGDPNVGHKAIEIEARKLGLPFKTWRMAPGLNRSETRKICAWAEEWGADLVHSHGYKFNILMGLFGKFTSDVPFVTTLHGYVHAPRFTRMWVYELLDRLCIRRMQQVVLVGETMKRELAPSLVNSPRVAIIRNGLDVDDIRTKAEGPLPAHLTDFFQAHDPVFLSVGRLSREKGFDQLIRHFREFASKYPKAGLVIAGEGCLRQELEGIIEQYGLNDSICMPGYCENIPSLMNRASLLVISSLTEGLPITLLEAMAVRLAIVSTAVGEIPLVLDKGESGILVSNLEKGLGDGIGLAMSDPAATKSRAENAFRTLTQTLSAESMAEQYSRVYQKALSL